MALRWLNNLIRGGSTRANEKPNGWFRKPRNRSGSIDSEIGETIHIRRWEAADTTRLNQAQWENARGFPVNVDLASKLDVLQSRCEAEISNNAYLTGMVESLVTDVVGEHGPAFRPHSKKNPAYARALELAVLQWELKPDINGQMSLADILSLWVRSLPRRGEFLTQMVSINDAETIIELRLHAIDTSRLMTPAKEAKNPRFVLGIERDKYGKPLRYYIAEPHDNELSSVSAQPTPIDAKYILHGYLITEPGQARGIPWFAPCLQTAADLRAFDHATITAARYAAQHAVVWFTDHPDAQYIPVNESTYSAPGESYTGPPGWKPTQVKPEHPAATYPEFRDAKLAELGRVLCMPLMMVKLDASGHSFSSAHFDSKLYERFVRAIQAKLLEPHLDQIIAAIQRELQLSARAKKKGVDPVLADIPDDLTIEWNWPKIPPADPRKDEESRQLRMETVSLLITELESEGRTIEQYLADYERQVEACKAAGVPAPPLPWQAKLDQPQVDDSGGDGEDDEDDDGERIAAANRARRTASSSRNRMRSSIATSAIGRHI